MAEDETRAITPSDEDPTELSPGSSSIARPVAEPDIGPYHLVRLLGEGGMGEVWEAVQHQPIVRTVALKLVKRGMDTGQFVARFESERQALALMEHPAIARVIDGGATASGRPFFVMEYVEGAPVTAYCDEHRLTVAERLALFVAVCDGVQHAHQRGIIHRDLKPSNILVATVDGKPMPKIIDFGLAKAARHTLTDKSVHTAMGGWIGTPAYMSPEQAEITDDIDTRTDVYSLGVILYQLLSGSRPFDKETLETGGFDEVRRLIREVDPPRPSAKARSSVESTAEAARSRRTEPRVLIRRLEGDLDWIVMKALEKERERRYGSAAEMATDIERHLANRPVTARPPSRAYRARKYVRRHRLGVAAAAAIAVALIAGTALATWQAVRATRAESRLLQRQGQAENLISFMVGDLRQKLEPVGRLDILEDVGEEASAYFATIDPLELSDDEVFRRSKALTQIGDVRLAQGELAGALQSFREARDLAADLVRRDPANGEWRAGLGAAHFWIGNVAWLERDLDTAEREFRAYQEAVADLPTIDPERLDWRMEVGYAHSNLGSVLSARGDPAGALEEFRATEAIVRDVVDADNSPLWRRELSQSLSWQGDALLALGDLQGALAQHRASRDLARALFAADPANTNLHYHLGLGHNQVGAVLELLGRDEEALASFLEELGVFEALHDHDGDNVVWQRELGVARQRVGTAKVATGDVPAGLAQLNAARDTLGELTHGGAGSDRRLDLGNAVVDLAAAELASGHSIAAAERAREALAICDPILASVPQDGGARTLRARALLILGAADREAGRDADAQERLQASESLLAELATGSPEPTTLDHLARARLSLGRVDEAEEILARLRETGYRRWDLVRWTRRHGVVF